MRARAAACVPDNTVSVVGFKSVQKCLIEYLHDCNKTRSCNDRKKRGGKKKGSSNLTERL